MKKLFFTLALAALFASCKKNNNNVPDPTANFTFSRNQTNELRLLTADTTTLISSAKNVSSISWDLGDGRTSNNSQFVLSYPKSGTYTVTLTAKSENGKQITVSKKVTVLDRVLKQINFKRIYWSLDPNFRDTLWPLTATADVYLKIQVLKPGEEVFQGIYSPTAQVIYNSPLIKNVPSSGGGPYTLGLGEKLVLEKQLLEDRRYLITLIAKNANGEYWLASNRASGASQTVNYLGPNFNKLIVELSSFSLIDMYLDLE